MRPNDAALGETQTHRPDGIDGHSATIHSDGNSDIQSTAFVDNQGTLFRFANFEILEVIGHGGMGVVYKAREMPLGRIVALKQLDISAARDRSYRERFLIEARAVAALSHPNIVPIYHYDVENGQPYFTMKFLPNGTLSQKRDEFRGNARAAVALMIKVARAVHHAHMHEYKILHRDLKPHNIFFDENNEPMVGDFGLAKLLDGSEEITQAGSVLGTPAYMAPEQRLGRTKDLCYATDVFALGVTLHELIVGMRPFDLPAEASTATRESPLSPIASPTAPLDPTLDAIIQKCLLESPGLRYRTAAAFADELEQWLAGKAVAVPINTTSPGSAGRDVETAVLTPSAASPPKTRLSRRSSMFVLAAIGSLLAVTAMALTLWGLKDQSQPAQLRRDIESGQTVNLLNPDGTLRWSDTLGTNVRIVKSSVEDGMPQITLACDTYGLVEVVHGLPDKEMYLFEAEIREDDVLPKGSRHAVGLYVGRSRQEGSSHCFVCAQMSEHRLADPAAQGTNIEFAVTYLGPPWKSQTIEKSLDSESTIWRKVSIATSPTYINPAMGVHPPWGKSKTDLLGYVSKLGLAQAQISGVTPGFRGSDGFGVYLAHSEATIRNMRITKVSKQ